MIKKITILLLLAFAVTLYGSNGWRQVTQSSYSSLNGVFFLNDNLGWIAGSSGTILRTTDGGYTWEPTNALSATTSMYSIYFVNKNVGYAGGSKDLLLKTTDGGATWSEVTFEAGNGTVYSIYFADENIGWVLSGASKGGTISHTTDGGASWSIQVTEIATNLRAMDFSSSGHGICVGSKAGSFAFYYTKDGLTWTKAPTPTGIPAVYSRTNIYAVAMASDNVASVSGWGSRASGLQPTLTIRTDDGGANWEYKTQTEEDKLYVNMYGMEFINELTGITVGGSSYKGGVAYKTVDGGVTWKEINLPIGFSCKAISMINNKVCIVGAGGGIVVSDDAGATWTFVTEIVNSTLKSIKQLPNGNIIAAGFYGSCLISSDNGDTWRTTYATGNNICPTVEDLFFLNENIGYSAHRNRTVSKTTDGGISWTQIMKDTVVTSFNNNGVQFLNENIGFVVGKYGSNVSSFLKTSDGGANWSAQIASLPNELNTLHFFDANNGVVAGKNSTLAFTTDGGDTWNTLKINNDPSGDHNFNEIEFLNSNFGLACGDILIKSNDAGKTWDYVAVDGLPKKIKACEIVDEQTWYLAGDKFLFKTVDGGVTFSDVFDKNVVKATQTYDIVVDSKGYPWLATGSSKIYTTSPKVDVKLVSGNLPNKFLLEANYPNPFNPSTKIKYSLPSTSSNNVTLKVYNLLGQEVATLVNEVQKSGTYEVEFNATQLSSGIYIYTLQSAGLLQSRKMLLIK